MSATVLYMSMSLDGFIAGPDDDHGNGLGVDGHRLHDWLSDGADVAGHRPSGVSGEVFDELMATGAVVAGRRTFELAGGWSGDHHDGVPIFVLTRRPGDNGAPDWPLVTYVSDVETAMARAKHAAGDQDVLVQAPARRSSRWPPACSASWRFTRSPSSSARAAASSTTSAPTTSSWSSRGSSTRPASPTCATASAARG